MFSTTARTKWNIEIQRQRKMTIIWRFSYERAFKFTASSQRAYHLALLPSDNRRRISEDGLKAQDERLQANGISLGGFDHCTFSSAF